VNPRNKNISPRAANKPLDPIRRAKAGRRRGMRGVRIVSQRIWIRAFICKVSLSPFYFSNLISREKEGEREKYHSHSLPDDKDKCLVCDLVRVREEEEGEGYVEEGEGGYYRCGGYERHFFCPCLALFFCR
jgi:hypothetical protein